MTMLHQIKIYLDKKNIWYPLMEIAAGFGILTIVGILYMLTIMFERKIH